MAAFKNKQDQAFFEALRKTGGATRREAFVLTLATRAIARDSTPLSHHARLVSGCVWADTSVGHARSQAIHGAVWATETGRA